MENREIKLEHLDPLKWLRPPFVWDQCQERRWNIQEKEMSLTVSSTEIQSFSLALMTNCWFSTAVWSIQNFNCWSFGHCSKGCLEAILYECCCTQYLKLFSEALFRIIDQFTKWVLNKFFPFSTANISTLVSLSCTGTLKILTKCSFETPTCIFILRCLAHDKAQIYRIFSYGAHSILSDQVSTLKFWNLAKFSLPI